ncbi:MAG: (2Fe-2S)-binding protein [Calditrichaceae bacterium]
MSEDLTPKSSSRRKFLKSFSTGLIGTSVLVPMLPAAAHLQTKSQEGGRKDEGKKLLSLTVNGKSVTAHVNPETTLAEFLREQLNMTGTKVVCNHGECGSCTVILNGQAVYSCHMLALDAQGSDVITIEGLMDGEKLHPLQESFVEKDGLQCGFCTPGQIMAAYALLLKVPHPTRDQVIEGMSGNLCRCAAYPKIIDSVLDAANK